MTLTSYKKLNTKNKIIIKIIIFLFLIIALFYFLFLPLLTSIEQSKKDIINAKIDIHNSNDQAQNSTALAKKLKNIEPQINNLNKVFINKNRELEFITNLEGIANKNNIKQTIDLKNIPDTTTSFTTIAIDIKASGNFNNLISYLSDLETNYYYININNLDITSLHNAHQTTLSFNHGEQTNIETTDLNMDISADAFFK